MTSITTKPDSLQPAAETAAHLFDNWFDPIETEVRGSGAAIHRGVDPRRARHSACPAALRAKPEWPAMKKERALPATATGAGRGR